MRPRIDTSHPLPAAGPTGCWRFGGLFFGLLLPLLPLLHMAACNVPTGESNLPPSDSAPFTVISASLPIADRSAAQPLNPTIGFTFSDYLDPGTISFPQLRFGPRGQYIQFTYTVSLVDKSLVMTARDHLLPNTDYFIVLDSQIRSLSGRALADGEGFQLTFHTGTQSMPVAPAQPKLTLTQLLAAPSPLQTSCAIAGCHSSQDGSLPAQGLDFSGTPTAAKMALLDGRRVGPALLLLVEPGRPETSYLLRKLLARRDGGFLQIDGDPMPPPDAQAAPLDDDFLRKLETWIRDGAN